MKYRKIPVTIEAFQLRANEAVPDWFLDAFEHNLVSDFFTPNFPNTNSKPDFIGCRIHTPEGIVTASPGDYIIRGVNGELYPCKPNIFAKTYEPIEEDNHQND